MQDSQELPSSSEFPKQLVDGFVSFSNDRFKVEQQRYRELAENGQRPRTLVVGCCDSRVSPEVIFNAAPGELFVLRNVANLIPPYAPNDDYHGTSAAIEFAVMSLRVRNIVVLGHGHCGGIRAYVENVRDPYSRPLSSGDFIGKWNKLLRAACERLGSTAENLHLDEFAEKLALESISQSICNLRTFPWIKRLHERGLLQLHGAYFSISDGCLLCRDPQTGAFSPVQKDACAATQERS